MKNIAIVLLTLVFTSPTLAKDTLEVQKTQPAVTNESTCPQPSAASKDNIDIDTLGMPISYDFTLEKKKRISLSNVIISINSEVDTGIYMFGLHLNNIARDHYGLDINYFSGSVCVYDIFKNEQSRMVFQGLLLSTMDNGRKHISQIQEMILSKQNCISKIKGCTKNTSVCLPPFTSH